VLVQDVIDALARFGPVEVTTLPGIDEKITFRLPPQLTAPGPAAPMALNTSGA